jgi:hypothetical protein
MSRPGRLIRALVRDGLSRYHRRIEDLAVLGFLPLTDRW